MENWVNNIKPERIYSQKGQDGVLKTIFENIEKQNEPQFCVEFGFNSDSLTYGTGANSANLILNYDWDSLLLDCDNENHDINLYKETLTSDNICDVLQKYNVPKSPDLVSIDVDSIDLWLMKSLLKCYTPAVIQVEYNCIYPITDAVTFVNETNHEYKADSSFGASLKALNMVANENDYHLIYCVNKHDLFFVRGDLIESEFIPLLKTFKKCTNHKGFKKQANKERRKLMVPYEG